MAIFFVLIAFFLCWTWIELTIFVSSRFVSGNLDEKFKDFVKSIQYRDLLSFLSILIAELIEVKYPQLESIFDGTLVTIQTALNTLLNTANREKDPDFYKKSDHDPTDPAANGIDVNWVSMILEMMLKLHLLTNLFE